MIAARLARTIYTSARSLLEMEVLHKCAPPIREEENAVCGWFVERRGIRSDFFGPLAIAAGFETCRFWSFIKAWGLFQVYNLVCR